MQFGRLHGIALLLLTQGWITMSHKPAPMPGDAVQQSQQ